MNGPVQSGSKSRFLLNIKEKYSKLVDNTPLTFLTIAEIDTVSKSCHTGVSPKREIFNPATELSFKSAAKAVLSYF